MGPSSLDLTINSVRIQTTRCLNLVILFLLFLPSLLRSGEQTDTTNQRAFKVEVVGQGKPMILIPGLSSAGEVWESTVAHYKSTYQCHILTLAGFAGEHPIEAPFLEKVRLQLAEYIRQKGLEKPVVVGHSLGGFLTLWLASSEPDLVGPLVIVDGLPFLAAAQMPNATVETIKPRAEMMRKMIGSQTPEQFRKSQPMVLGTMITDSANIAIALKWGEASDPKTVGQAVYELYTTDIRSDLVNIKSPTLVIGTWIGMKPWVNREQVEQTFEDQFKGLTNCKIVLSDKAKHFVMLDDPEGFFESMDSFLSTSDGKKK